MTLISLLSFLLWVYPLNVNTVISITGNSVAQMQGGFQSD